MCTIDRKDVGGYSEDLFDDMLDEIYGEVNVGVTFAASRVLSELDPIAYACGFNDWVGGLDDEFDGGRYECGQCGERYSREDAADECCQGGAD